MSFHAHTDSASVFGFFPFVKVAKIPQVVQQQTPVASIQQVASASQQVGSGDQSHLGGTHRERSRFLSEETEF